MKHKLSKRILSTLLAMVMLIGLLPTAAIPTSALDINEIDAYEEDYQYGYFLEDGTWVRLVYDWDDMDQVFENLNSATMTNYGYVTIKLMENLELSTKSSSFEEYFMKWKDSHGILLSKELDYISGTVSFFKNACT